MKKLGLSAIVIAALMLALVPGAVADEGSDTKAKVKKGAEAPDFEIPEAARKGELEGVKKLSDLKGKKNVVLAFYPKAFTPGCTKQMCGYRDEFAAFKDTDTLVIALSVDNQEDADGFKKEHNLPFPVVGDPDHEIIKKYGVPLLSRGDLQYAKRVTFLVDKEGVVQYTDMDYHFLNGQEPLFEAMKKIAKK